MPERFIEVRLEREAYQPGELLAGAFVVYAEDEQPNTVELSVLWHTSGKGDEDMQVLHFREWPSREGAASILGQPQEVTLTLPRSPLNYDGFLIKVHWCVRVRVRWARGRDTVQEAAFRLGNVARPEVSPS
jgi:hypothetical protein